MITYSTIFFFERQFEDYSTIRPGPGPEDSVNRLASATILRAVFSQVRPRSMITACARFLAVPYWRRILTRIHAFPLSRRCSEVLESSLHFENHYDGRGPVGFQLFRDTDLIGGAQALDARPPYSRSFATAPERLCVPIHGNSPRTAGQGVGNPATDHAQALRELCATRDHWGVGVSPDPSTQWLGIEAACFRSAFCDYGDGGAPEGSRPGVSARYPPRPLAGPERYGSVWCCSGPWLACCLRGSQLLGRCGPGAWNGHGQGAPLSCWHPMSGATRS